MVLMGQPGTGKTSFINTFLNRLLNINYKIKKKAKVIKANEDEIKIYEFKLQQDNIGLRIIKTPGLQLDEKDQEIFVKLDNILEKYPNINAICITCPGSFVRLDDEKKLLYDKIIDFFGENLYNNVLFLITFSDSEPHFEKLKLFMKKNKPFTRTLVF